MEKNRTKIWAPLILVFLLTSCASTPKTVALSTYNLENQDKIDLAVVLQLSHDCGVTQEIQHNIGTPQSVLLIPGTIFCENAEQMAKALFTEVSIVEPDQKIPESGVDAVLTLQIKSRNYAMPLWAGSTYRMLIIIEWSLTSISGDLIWTETIEGRCDMSGGNYFTYKKAFQQNLQMATDDLFQKTYEEIINSREIRAFAKAQ